MLNYFYGRAVLTMAVGLTCLAGIAAPADAQILPFGQTEDFESETSGNAATYVLPHAGHGTATVATDGSNQYALVQPGADDSRGAGVREAPYGNIGRQNAFPGSGDTYTVFVDIYAASAPTATGTFAWLNMVQNVNTPDSYLDENMFVITPGDATWNVVLNGGDGGSTQLDTDAWYTFAMTWDRSVGLNYDVIGEVYEQGDLGQSAPLFSSVMTQNTLSADLGGPLRSWFTLWSNDTVDSINIDNFGSTVIPEPASLALLGVGGLLMLRRRNRA